MKRNFVFCTIVVSAVLIAGCGRPYGGADGCFIAGTMIATPNGPKPIETLNTNDVVYSYDIGSRQVVSAPVDEVTTHQSESVQVLNLSNGTTLEVTADHPIFESNSAKWVPAGELVENEVLLSIENSQEVRGITVTAIAEREMDQHQAVYN